MLRLGTTTEATEDHRGPKRGGPDTSESVRLWNVGKVKGADETDETKGDVVNPDLLRVPLCPLWFPFPCAGQ